MLKTAGDPTSRFILFCLGSHGDVFPFLAIGGELQARGYEVSIATNSFFAELIESRGLGFIPVGDAESLRLAGSARGINTTREGWKVALQWGALGTMRAMHSVALSHADGRTVFASQGSCFGVRIARDQVEFPLATFHLDPVHFRSLYKSPVMPPMVLEDWVPRISKRFQLWCADRYWIDPVLEPANEFRRELGLPRVQRFLHHWVHSPDLAIGMFPSWYAEPQPDWPEQAVLASFPLADPKGEADDEAAAFAKQAADRLLIFAPGTAGPGRKDYFHEAAKICQRLNASGILLTRAKHLIPEELPENVRHFSYVQMEVVLKHASALIHHGGIGTVGRALLEGVPQFVAPKAFNQPDDARRVKRLGVGDFIEPADFNVNNVSPPLERLIESKEVAENCKIYAAKLAQTNGTELACNELEKLIAKLPSHATASESN